MILHATEVLRDEGTVVVFGSEEGPSFAVDHRMAGGLANLIEEEGPVSVHVEGWQVLGVKLTITLPDDLPHGDSWEDAIDDALRHVGGQIMEGFTSGQVGVYPRSWWELEGATD